MSFYKFQLFSTVALLIVSQLFAWFGLKIPVSLSFNEKSVDLTFYYILFSWIYTLGFFVKSAIEQRKSKILNELNLEFGREIYDSELRNRLLKEKNKQLQEKVLQLERLEKDFETYKIQNRSAKEANQQAFQSFL